MKSRAVRSLRDYPEIPICIEMYHKMWTDEFMKYSCRDLCAGGKVFENPDILNTTEKIKNRIKNGHFLVTPCNPEELFVRNQCLDGYICIGDTPEGMRIHHTWEDVRK